MGADRIINIDSIQNEALKRLAEASNVVTTEDRELKGSEISVFADKAEMSLASNPGIGFTKDDVSALLGFEKSTPAVDEAAAPAAEVKPEAPKAAAPAEEPKKEEVKEENKAE